MPEYVRPEPSHNCKKVTYIGGFSPTKGAAVGVGLCLLLAGCRAGYVAKVGLEHLRYVNSAVPIEQLLLDTDDEERRGQLTLILEARAWGGRNGLDVGGSYRSLADTKGRATAHVVTAAYSDRLEPYEWSYPIVGKIPYRGYFEREAADRFAATLSARGLDTYVVEASGYSTLGWFDDPFPEGVLELDRVGIVSFLFHELLHQTVYVPGSIAFNESLASAVSGRLTNEFFTERRDEEALELLAQRELRWLAQAGLCDDLARRLTRHFETSKKGQGRKAILSAALPELRRLQLVREARSGEPDPELNNAWFLAVWRYRRGARELVDYLAGFESVGLAIADVRVRVEGADDPYAALPGSPPS